MHDKRRGCTRFGFFGEDFSMTEFKRICAAVVVAFVVGTVNLSVVPNSAAKSAAGGEVRGLAGAEVGADCKPVLDASNKTMDTPNHSYMNAVAADGRKRSTEGITIDGVQWVQRNGKWANSGVTVAQVKADADNKIKNAKVLSCKEIGDESVNGEAATVYAQHSETEKSKSDGKVWVSKSRGVILKNEIDLESAATGKQHVSFRYEYGNVKAPI
jgi:hypothetical protein